MLRSFFIITLRILWRNKVTSAINILSLSIGITAFILIMLYVHHETGYDKFNENYDQIYRLEGDGYARLPTIIGDHLRDKIPEIEHITLIQHGRIQNFIHIDQNNPANSVTIQTQLIRADSAIFNIFTLPFIQGNPKTALNEPFTIVLTESTAKRLFGSKNPIGETIALENLIQSNNEYHVTGIIRDVTKSHVDIDALISLETVKELQIPRDYNYHVSDRFWNGTYILLAKNADADVVTEKINNVLSEINDGSKIRVVFKNFHLEALKDLYLNSSSTELQFGEKGNGDLLWSFLAIALFVLLLAIINYVNLTTARSLLRSKEVIIKKVMGSSRSLLRQQFIAESIILTFISFLIALTVIQLLLPLFNQLAMTNIISSEFNTPGIWITLFAAVIMTGFISGIYPAVMLTSFRSVANIQGQSMSGSRGALIRRLLLTVQFSISIILIIAILTNVRQLQFVKKTNIGFNKEHVILINHPMGFDDQYMNRKTFKNRLIQYQSIQKVTFTNRRFGHQEPGHFELEFDGEKKGFQGFQVDPDYLDVMEIGMVEGRNLFWDRLSDVWLRNDTVGQDKLSIIINETAARAYWEESPVGKTCSVPGPDATFSFEIIGVFKDFHFRSMHHNIEPMVLYWREYPANMLAKISPVNLQSAIKTIEKEWKNVYGSEPFTYSFLDETYEKQYQSDERSTTIIGYFTILAIVIACMGLFALSSFMAVRKTKEIGVRKALGASSMTIFIMLSREYIKWILLSVLIASPVAWFAMNKWLETFAYRIELGPGVFILAALLALVIGLITVGWQALKSANSNPVEALRYE